MSKFQELGLDPRIVKGLDTIGFIELFPIQEQTLTPLLQGKDLIGQAKTGTGKTAAYAIPMLQGVEAGNRNIQGLIITPTRELASQVVYEIKRMGRYTGIQAMAVYGGQSIETQLGILRRGVQILVGTPGRTIDLIRRGAISLSKVKYVVLDEADTMLDMGFIDDIEYIIGELPSSRQVSLFSATMPERIIRLSDRYMKNSVKILLDTDELSVETLDQKYIMTDRKFKLGSLARILNEEKPSNVIVFCATKMRVDRLAWQLQDRFSGVGALHGNLSQNQRDKIMQSFRAQKIRILVATDLAARGLDIPHVDCIVNYDVPKNPLLYFHRVGRTARAGGSGKSFTFVSQEEFEDFVRIQDITTVNIKPAYPDDEKKYSRSLNLNRPQRRRFDFEDSNDQVSKYCERCGKWVNGVLESGLIRCKDCGKILQKNS
ncbi:MAG: DEAD/DEAH box helicase [Candidatus Bathyarchaeota archaeon]